MAVVSFVSNKGGVGKTTSAIIFACEVAKAYDVILIDADPGGRAFRWSETENVPARIRSVRSDGPESIEDEIEDAVEKADFVLVDLAGYASMVADRAIMQSDVVVIPTSENQWDAEDALASVRQVQRRSKTVGRHIAPVVVRTRTRAAVKSRTSRHIAKTLIEAEGVNLLEPEIVERDAFQALASIGGSINSMPSKEVNGLDKARANAAAYADALLDVVREQMAASDKENT